jgi:hypothetical protein
MRSISCLRRLAALQRTPYDSRCWWYCLPRMDLKGMSRGQTPPESIITGNPAICQCGARQIAADRERRVGADWGCFASLPWRIPMGLRGNRPLFFLTLPLVQRSTARTRRPNARKPSPRPPLVRKEMQSIRGVPGDWGCFASLLWRVSTGAEGEPATFLLIFRT